MIYKAKVISGHTIYSVQYAPYYMAFLRVSENEVSLTCEHKIPIEENGLHTFKIEFAGVYNNQHAVEAWERFVCNEPDKQESIEAAKAALSKPLL